MNSAQAGALAATITVPIAMALLAKAFPAKSSPQSAATLESLKRKYAKWENRLKFVYLALWVPVTAAIWLPLQTISDWHGQLLSPAESRITPGPIFWFIPAFFLALVLSAMPLAWLTKKWLGPNFHEYETYIRLKTKYDIDRVNRSLYWIVGVLFTLAVFLGLDWYVLVRADALVVNPLLGFGETVHPYTDVITIQTAPRLIAPNGNIVWRREFVVRFRDGQTWSTNSIPANMREAEKRELATLISKRSGTPIEEIAVFQKDAL